MSDTITPLTEKDGESKDLVAENIEKLKQLFPEIVTDGKVDFETLEEVLGDYKEDSQERYSFTWNGKSKARKLAMTPSRGTLRPAPEESVNWDSTDNLFIEGDNLEVLKLLQRSYHGKVKMIYIDPPYNTGNDFVYPDDYKDSIGNYLKQTGQVDDEGKKITTNPEYSGRYHTDWLNMMYPRLKLSRELLKEDGVIFSSTGVEEVANLKKMMDEIFGEENFVEIFSWVKTSTPPALSTKSRKTNEYILCYEKNKNSIRYKGELLEGGDQPLLNRGNKVRKLKFPKSKVYFNERKFKDGLLPAQRPDRVELHNDLQIKDGYANEDIILEGEFKWTQDFLNEEIDKGTTFIIKSEILSIRFIRDEDGYKPPTNFIKEKYTTPLISKPNTGVGTNENASSELQDLFGEDYFDYPKPTSLISYLSRFSTNSDDIILDFFAGSGSTGDAVFKNNIKKDYSQKFILVQLPEIIDPSSATDSNQKKKLKKTKKFLESLNRPPNIAELCKERLKRCNEKYTSENPGYNGDLGFKTFKLNTSNLKPWDPTFDKVQLSIEDSIENIKPDRSEQDVLYEILLKYGLDLSLPIEEKEIAGSKVFVAGVGALFICLAPNIDLEVVEGISKLKDELEPELTRVVFRDSGFEDDVVKTNAVQILKQHGIEDVRSI